MKTGLIQKLSVPKEFKVEIRSWIKLGLLGKTIGQKGLLGLK